jgi:hypothetical protein
MQPPTRSHSGAARDPGDLCGGEPFPLGQEQYLAITRRKRGQRFTHLGGQQTFLDPNGPRLSVQLFVEPHAPGIRPSLIRQRPARHRVQPGTSVVPARYLVKPPPGNEKHLSDGILIIAC